MGKNDEFYRKLLIKHNVFVDILNLLIETESKNNLLNSAILELFEYVRKGPDGTKALVAHIAIMAKKHMDKLAYVDTFKGIIQKYEQGLEVIEEISKQRYIKIKIV